MTSKMAALMAAVALVGCGGSEGPVDAQTEGAALSVTASLSSLSASSSVSSWYMVWRWPAGPQQDPPVVIYATGGVPPYSYSWQRLSGDPSSYAVNPNSASTDFNNYIPVGDQNAYTSIWRGVVTDSTGATASTSNIFVSLQVTGYHPGGGGEP
ncbi:hypothetical protein [Hyalangium versicolor]|uniref:hypothetical protein n=1 Tax=Hyalangium versicolor TaxID=2861190 RepID=UPI001CCEC19D|nr:hypothetical protein [Hyalangium versicolor]